MCGQGDTRPALRVRQVDPPGRPATQVTGRGAGLAGQGLMEQLLTGGFVEEPPAARVGNRLGEADRDRPHRLVTRRDRESGIEPETIRRDVGDQLDRPARRRLGPLSLDSRFLGASSVQRQAIPRPGATSIC